MWGSGDQKEFRRRRIVGCVGCGRVKMIVLDLLKEMPFFVSLPRCSMYEILTYMYHRFIANVGKYIIHGDAKTDSISPSYGNTRPDPWGLQTGGNLTPRPTSQGFLGLLGMFFPSLPKPSTPQCSAWCPEFLRNLGVEPKIRVFYPPKWMVKIMENPIKMDDLGGPPLFLETPICSLRCKYHLTSFIQWFITPVNSIFSVVFFYDIRWGKGL